MPGLGKLDSMWKNTQATGTYATSGETLSSAFYISNYYFEIDDQDLHHHQVADQQNRVRLASSS